MFIIESPCELFQIALLVLPRFQRLLQRTLNKVNGLAERDLRQMVHVCLDYAGNARIAAGRLGIVHQYNRLTVVRNLNHARQQTVRH